VVNGDASKAKQAITAVIENDNMQVCGGELEKIGNSYFMVFGQNYPRAYDGQSGNYTEKVVQFTLSGTPPSSIVVEHNYLSYAIEGLSPYHRRDLNVLPSILNGTEGLMAWSGVFTETQGAWGHPVLIAPDGNRAVLKERQDFTQKANLYESASVLQYDPASKVMYTSMLGGISNYFFDPQQDTVVPSDTLDITEQLPFVKLINTIVMTPDTALKEYIQGKNEMLPTYLGANAQFIPSKDLLYNGEILDYSKIKGKGKVLIGYMVGGIRATGPQSGNGTPTYANDKVYAVYSKPI